MSRKYIPPNISTPVSWKYVHNRWNMHNSVFSTESPRLNRLLPCWIFASALPYPPKISTCTVANPENTYVLINEAFSMSRDDLHTKRCSPSRVDLPVLPRESPSGKIQTRYFPPRREISETNNSCSCSCSHSCSNLSHSWCMGEQLSYIHCWGVPQGSRSRPPASTGTLRYTPPV